MKRLQNLWPVIVFLACSSMGTAAFAEEPPRVENGQELLILRNGQILEGRITKLKNHYSVNLPDGEIRIRTTEVEFVCRNLDEGYQRKRSVIESGNWQEHLELARWCQKHGMTARASAELDDASAISPGNPLVSSIRRQVEAVVEPSAPLEKATPLQESVSNEELDRMVRSLPPKVLESFTQSIQPLLMNNCTAMGCHGPQSATNLRLLRVPVGQSANRRLTQRNLYAVLQYIDRENPAVSPLLTLPTRPHGSAKNAIYTEQRATQYNRIVEWVVGLGPSDNSYPTENLANQEPSQNTPSALPENSSTPPRVLSQDARKAKPLSTAVKSRGLPSRGSDATNEVTAASYQEPPAGFLQTDAPRLLQPTPPQPTAKPAPPIAPPTMPPTPSKIKRGAPLPQAGTKDPFDPEVFNRRYHKEDKPLEGVRQPSEAKKAGEPTDLE